MKYYELNVNEVQKIIEKENIHRKWEYSAEERCDVNKFLKREACLVIKMQNPLIKSSKIIIICTF